jgi:hypothetical protein
VLFLYGPFRRGGQHTAPSNETFDLELRRKNPAWGVRDIDEVISLATTNSFGSPIIEEMPANNLSVIMRRL